MSFFGLGRLVYVIILITNSIAILSEDRFLARIGWGRTQQDPAFGAAYDSTSVKAKTINLIASVRTVMRSTYLPPASIYERSSPASENKHRGLAPWSTPNFS
ncbi:Yos1-like-domain-containing protein [Aspergillus karnatakaensis]|uniref:YOS1 family protein n=1 Tax=Aspergillus karnatakaensis TaxID=1810916 RepID=UPI003CCCD377